MGTENNDKFPDRTTTVIVPIEKEVTSNEVIELRDDFTSRLHLETNPLKKALSSPGDLSDEEIKYLLSSNVTGEHFEEITGIKRDLVGERVFVRASIEISNFCRLACRYCGMSRNNKSLERFRLEKKQILRQVELARQLGVDIIHLTSAEDPDFPIDDLCAIVRFVINQGMEVVLVLGDKKVEEYQALYDAGARKFTMKFETSDPEILREVKGGYSPMRRLELIQKLRAIGFKIGTGIIVGLPGQTLDTLVSDLRLLQEMKPEMASASVFVPNKDSDFADVLKGDTNLAIRFNLLIRLLLRNPVPTIPSSSSFSTEEQIKILQTAANVVSIHLTPEDVALNYSMYGGRQRIVSSVDRVKSLIVSAGLTSNLK